MFEDITAKLNNAESVGIFVHVNPDGDALGSAFSLKNVLMGEGKNADVYYDGETEPCLKEIFGIRPESDKGGRIALKNEHDLLIALDCADLNRLGVYAEIFSNHKNTAAIDHHITHVKYAESAVVQEISSTCELIFKMYKEMKAEITVKTAEYLYTGIATDTGSFKFSSVNGDTHRAVAELIDMGVDFAALSKRIFDTKSKEYFKLYAYAVNSMEFYCGGAVAVLKLSEDDFKRFGITEASASAVVSVPGRVEGVKLGVYVRSRRNECKVSLRSSGEVDVARLAVGFGGGGHKCAAGYSVEPDYVEENLKMLIDKAEAELRQTGNGG